MRTLCCRTIEFEVVTHVEERPRLPSQDSGVPGRSNFQVSPVSQLAELVFYGVFSTNRLYYVI